MKQVRSALSLLAASTVAALFVCVGAGQAAAQQIARLGEFGQWRAFSYNDDGNKTCYMASQPTEAEGDYDKRGDIYAMVTHRPWKETRDVVSFVIGYPFKQDSTVSVDIDGKKFTLFTHQDTAWAPDKQTDQAMVEAMVEGVNMVVKGTSTRGTLTTDTYSLIGFTKAHEAIDRACPPK